MESPRLRLALGLAVTVLLGAAATSASAVVVKYHVVALAQDGSQVGLGSSMSKKGIVAGTWNDQAALFDHGNVSWPAQVPGATYTFAAGINAGGHVVGSAVFGDVTHAILWKGTAAKDLGTLFRLSDERSKAVAINAADEVLIDDDDGYIEHAVVWSRGRKTEIARPAGTQWLSPAAMNDLGHVAGTGRSGSFTMPFIYRDGTLAYLSCGSCSGTPEALAINGADVIVGWSNMWDGTIEALAWAADGTLLGLGGLPNGDYSYAFGINDAGTIVGQATMNYDRTMHAFVYADNVMSDMNDLLDDASSDWELGTAQAIDSRGAIAGFGTFKGTWMPFLATPVKQ